MDKPDRFSEAIVQLEHCIARCGQDGSFWKTFLAALTGVAEARYGVLLRPSGEKRCDWRRALSWPDETSPQQFLEAACEMAEACRQQRALLKRFHTSAAGIAWCAGVALEVGEEAESEPLVAIFLLVGREEREAEEALRRLRLLPFLTEMHQLRKRATQSEIAVSHFASVLDLVALLNGQHRFLAVAMTLCNELAARHHCERVSLGWIEGDYVKVKVMSHSERFEEKMEAVRQLEAAMEEALDQDEIVVLPTPEEQGLVVREHERFAVAQKVASVCSLPLLVDGLAVGVLTCERGMHDFPEVEVRLLALCGEMSARRLAELKVADRWVGARWLASIQEQLAGLLKPEHIGAKLAALAAAFALAVLCFGHKMHRIESRFSLRAEDAAFLSAPFEGFIDQVQVEVGAVVKKGDVLAALDTRELLLEEANAAAEHTRFLVEEEKAAGTDRPADAGIARAQAEQARSRLELVRYRQSQSQITAPFDGVVIEGDLKKRIGAPLKKGEVLFRIARIDRLYVECEVDERDIPLVRENAGGEIAFSSQPKWKFPIRVKRIEPSARAEETANVFLVHAEPVGPPPDWWRPGMSGLVRIEDRSRSLLWIVSHRTVEYLRMNLWW